MESKMRLSFVNQMPHIEVWDDVFTQDDADFIMSLAEPNLRRSEVVDFETRDSIPDPSRTSSDYFFGHGELIDHQSFFLPIIKKLEFISNIPMSHYELPTVIMYRPGEEYVPHADCYADDPEEKRRIATFVMYLNDADGGETEFTKIGLKVYPKVGRVLYFNYNTYDEYYLESTTHKGCTPITGQKWIVSVWVKPTVQWDPLAYNFY